jgi:hypothetical protein
MLQHDKRFFFRKNAERCAERLNNLERDYVFRTYAAHKEWVELPPGFCKICHNLIALSYDSNGTRNVYEHFKQNHEDYLAIAYLEGYEKMFYDLRLRARMTIRRK